MEVIALTAGVVSDISKALDTTLQYSTTLSTPGVIRQLNHDNKQKSLLLNLNLIYETLWTEAESSWLISMLEKFNLIR